MGQFTLILHSNIFSEDIDIEAVQKELVKQRELKWDEFFNVSKLLFDSKKLFFNMISTFYLEIAL